MFTPLRPFNQKDLKHVFAEIDALMASSEHLEETEPNSSTDKPQRPSPSSAAPAFAGQAFPQNTAVDYPPGIDLENAGNSSPFTIVTLTASASICQRVDYRCCCVGLIRPVIDN